MSKILSNVRYLPIGDSYTIGEGVPINENFPSQLSEKLNQQNHITKVIANPAVTGFTTQNVIEKQLPLLKSQKPNFCTLLIGVNDWVQQISSQTYKTNLEQIIEEIKKQVDTQFVVISIPDFSVSKEASKYSKGRNISKGIEEFNHIAKTITQQQNISFADIFTLSQQQNTAAYFAKDQLHPSPKAYEEWVSIILPKALKVLSPSPQLGV